MAEPLHHQLCPCSPCFSRRNPRALAVGAEFAPYFLPAPSAPEPLYPRGPDNTSDSTDAEMDRLRARINVLEAKKRLDGAWITEMVDALNKCHAALDVATTPMPEDRQEVIAAQAAARDALGSCFRKGVR